MSVRWRKLSEEKPAPDVECLTQMKHGYLSGYYQPDGEGDFTGYYFGDIVWNAKLWVPVSELDDEAQGR